MERDSSLACRDRGRRNIENKWRTSLYRNPYRYGVCREPRANPAHRNHNHTQSVAVDKMKGDLVGLHGHLRPVTDSTQVS